MTTAWERNLPRGEDCEDEVEALHLAEGHSIVRLHSFMRGPDNPPVILTPEGPATLPDFLGARHDGGRWQPWLEDSKLKKNPMVFRTRGFIEHGIDLDKFEDYRKVGRMLGMPVLLTVVEECTGLVLQGKLDYFAAEDVREGNRWWSEELGRWDGPLLNFRRERFTVWTCLSPETCGGLTIPHCHAMHPNVACDVWCEGQPHPEGTRAFALS